MHALDRYWPLRSSRLALSALAGATLLTGLALAGCGDDDDDDDTTATATTTVTATATNESEPTTPSGDESPTTSDPSGAIPTVPQDYAEAVFEAWADGDDDMLARLTSDEAYQVLSSTPWSADDDWQKDACEGAAGSTYCTWTGAESRLVLRIGNEAASQGEEHAAVEARFDTGEAPTQPSSALPNNAQDYARALYQAWSNADMARLRDLGTDEVVSALEANPWRPTDAWSSQGCEGAAGSVICTWQGTSTDLIVQVSNEAAANAQPQAVTAVEFKRA